MLYFIGIGLNDEKDITVKGLEAVKKCKSVYLEIYTSKLACSIDTLEKFYGKKIIPANRDIVENKAEATILKDAKLHDTAFLVIGDPLCATTHIDLMLRAKEAGIPVEVIHNASIISAIGITGLEVYKFGKTTSIPFDNKNVKAPYEVYLQNNKNGLHTLFLLDLKPDENKYLSIKDAIEYLIKQGISEDVKAVGCSHIGSPNPVLIYGKLKDIKNIDYKEPPFCIVIPGKLHFMEEEFLDKLEKEKK